MSKSDRLVAAALSSAAILCAQTACRPGGDAGAADHPSREATSKPAELLVFPAELRVAERSVNDFVERAMSVCAGGDYERFRLLFSARQDPLPRGEYDEGWQAVRRIRVRALEKVMLSPDPHLGRKQPEAAYAILAEVALDPAHRAGRRERNREVVLMMIREHDAWVLARPPKAMRAWLKRRVESRRSD